MQDTSTDRALQAASRAQASFLLAADQFAGKAAEGVGRMSAAVATATPLPASVLMGAALVREAAGSARVAARIADSFASCVSPEGGAALQARAGAALLEKAAALVEGDGPTLGWTAGAPGSSVGVTAGEEVTGASTAAATGTATPSGSLESASLSSARPSGAAPAGAAAGNSPPVFSQSTVAKALALATSALPLSAVEGAPPSARASAMLASATAASTAASANSTPAAYAFAVAVIVTATVVMVLDGLSQMQLSPKDSSRHLSGGRSFDQKGEKRRREP